MAHLAEFDRRQLHREQGYGSLFSYCTEALRLSEHATFNRIAAARTCRSFPVILDRLAEGAVNLSTVRLLAPHLTRDNHERLLEEARGRSKREVEVMVARLAPRPDVAASVRKLAGPRVEQAAPLASGAAAGSHATPSASATSSGVQSSPPAHSTSPAASPTTAPSSLTAPFPSPVLSPFPPTPAMPSPRSVVVPPTPERCRVQFTVCRETRDKLRRVQDLLRREIPDGDPGAIFDRALTLLLEDVARKKLAATTSPRASRGADPRARHVPAEVRHTVWLRDHGQCAFVSPGGRRCRERTFLEFHHVEAFGRGGQTTAANLSLRCREHNVYEAGLLFGPWGPGAIHEPRAVYSA